MSALWFISTGILALSALAVGVSIALLRSDLPSISAETAELAVVRSESGTLGAEVVALRERVAATGRRRADG